jgi:hypothetical protein
LASWVFLARLSLPHQLVALKLHLAVCFQECSRAPAMASARWTACALVSPVAALGLEVLGWALLQ